MGSYLGGGTPEQVSSLDYYFESVGIAFQIIDDVLNLVGLPGKVRGEDLSAGKVTYPIAKAMESLSREEDRAWLWNRVQARLTDPDQLDQVISLVSSCGALEACRDESHRLVEESWRALDPVLSDSFAKNLIRSFGWYVLERHY